MDVHARRRRHKRCRRCATEGNPRMMEERTEERIDRPKPRITRLEIKGGRGRGEEKNTKGLFFFPKKRKGENR